MQQSPSWEANSSSASHETPRILWNSEVHYCIHKRPPAVPLLSQINAFHDSASHCFKPLFNIILPSMPRVFKWFFLSGIPTKTLYATFLSPTRTTCPVYLVLPDLISHGSIYSLNVKGTFSQSYKTADKILLPYVWILRARILCNNLK